MSSLELSGKRDGMPQFLQLGGRGCRTFWCHSRSETWSSTGDRCFDGGSACALSGWHYWHTNVQRWLRISHGPHSKKLRDWPVGAGDQGSTSGITWLDISLGLNCPELRWSSLKQPGQALID